MKAGTPGECGALLGCLNYRKCLELSGIAEKIMLPKRSFNKLADCKIQKTIRFDRRFAVTFSCVFFIVINLLPGGIYSHKPMRMTWL